MFPRLVAFSQPTLLPSPATIGYTFSYIRGAHLRTGEVDFLVVYGVKWVIYHSHVCVTNPYGCQPTDRRHGRKVAKNISLALVEGDQFVDFSDFEIHVVVGQDHSLWFSVPKISEATSSIAAAILSITGP